MEKTIDIAVVGGGAAGFMAAITARQQLPGARVVILERARKVLAKVLISGGGRCNLTNSFASVSDLRQVYPRGHKLMKRLFNTFGPADARLWFESRGVPLVVQADECVFPQSQDSHSVARCLTDEARRLGVEVRTEHTLTAVRRLDDGRLQLLFKEQEPLCCRRAAITTGGSPTLRGLQHLMDMGHAIELPVPSLFTFTIQDAALRSLMGTVAERVMVAIPGTKLRAEGELLITHWGMSGPAILKLSSHAARIISEQQYRFSLSVNWLHQSNAAVVEEQLRSIAAANARKQLSSARLQALPTRLWLHLLTRAGLPAERKWAEMGSKGFNRLVETLTNDVYQVSGKSAFRDEFVTCGGVSLRSINPNTLESRHCEGLFFAGEVLDIDAITGGFNLQAAWTTGYVAGLNMAAGARSEAQENRHRPPTAP